MDNKKLEEIINQCKVNCEEAIEDLKDQNNLIFIGYSIRDLIIIYKEIKNG